MMLQIYAHQAESGNRVGLHYSHFQPKLTMPPFANQLLSPPKNRKIAIFERESAKTG
jgi:hypothetical protein